MSPIETNFEKVRSNRKIVAVEPAINPFTSMVLVASHPDEPGIHEWVTRTRAQMSAEEIFRHKLVTIGLHYSVVPQANAANFESYIAQLEATPPLEFRNHLLEGYNFVYEKYKQDMPSLKQPNWDEALTSADKYVSLLISIFGEEYTDVEIETRAYDYVIDPVELKILVTGHLRWFWENYLQAEWNRVQPMLDQTARAFNKLNLHGKSREELLSFITGREKNDSKWLDFIDNVKELIFIPNAHVGPYMRTFVIHDTAYVVFGAHLPEGSNIHIPELDRAEIVSKLSALADETRLNILQLVAERGEMRSTEIMDEIKLSQPSISRYLAQLTACGYLNEKRINSAKVYSLNSERIEKTLQAVSNFLLGRTR